MQSVLMEAVLTFQLARDVVHALMNGMLVCSYGFLFSESSQHVRYINVSWLRSFW